MVTDTLPAGVGFVSATASQGSCSQASGTVTCTLGGLGNGATATVTITVTAPGQAGTITNTAAVSGLPADPNGANDSDTEQTTMQAAAAADLSVAKTDSPDPVAVGGA